MGAVCPGPHHTGDEHDPDEHDRQGDQGRARRPLAENQERELETMISALMSLFEPILILTMGSVVLLIVLAILLPIFNLNQLVQ